MAEDSYIQQIVSALTGRPTSGFKEQVNLAPNLSNYPTSGDADYARQQGFSQGSINQPFLDNQAARLLGHMETYTPPTPLNLLKKVSNAKQKPPAPAAPIEGFLPESGAYRLLEKDVLHSVDDPNKSRVINPQTDSVFTSSQPERDGIRDNLDNVMMRAGLAANRSPIAAVGFDPNRTVIDALMGSANIGGAYLPSTDNIYSGLQPSDAIVHESTHRGFQKLRELYPEKMIEYQKQLPDEETTVRWLVNHLAGDPESKDLTADIGLKQRQQGIDMFSGDKYPALAERHNNALNQVQELAIEAMKNRGKRAGPQ